jgi:hypothetical protein
LQLIKTTRKIKTIRIVIARSIDGLEAPVFRQVTIITLAACSNTENTLLI